MDGELIIKGGMVLFFKKLFKAKEEHVLDYELILKDNGVMKFNKSITLLIISDTHGDIKLQKAMQDKLAGIRNYDACFMLGDISDNDCKMIKEVIPQEKIYGLLGNHDRFSFLEEHNIKNINGKVININGVRIAGIQGTFKYKPEYFPSYTHEESIEFLKSVPEADILLSHDKPFTFETGDLVHDGLKGITEYLYSNRVPINIHGHLHTSYIANLRNGTVVKGVYGIELITIRDGKII